MAWTDSVTFCTSTQINNSQKDARYYARLRLRGLRSTKRVRLVQNKSIQKFFIPTQFHCALIRCNTHIFLYAHTDLYQTTIPLPAFLKQVWFDEDTQILSYYQNRAGLFNQLFQDRLVKLLRSAVQLFFFKIKFRGKGYKITKSRQRKTLSFQFGHSHKILEYTFLVSVRAVLKQALILYGINSFDLQKIAENIRRWRPLNIYTGRGIRFSRQVVYRKQGKAKTYK